MSTRKKESSKDDIRLQLTDIQNRLFSSSSRNRTRGIPSNASEATKQREKDTLVQHEGPKRTVEQSSRGNRALPGMPAVSQQMPTLGLETKGNDMGFVVSLSENLLSECRKLNAENQKYKSKLKTALLELQSHKEQVSSLTNSRELQINNENALNEKIWELSSQVTVLTERIGEITSENEKLTNKNKQVNDKLNTLQSNCDELQQQKVALTEDFESFKQKHTKEKKEANLLIEELNNENDKLHNALTTQKSMEPSHEKMRNIDDVEVMSKESYVDDDILTEAEQLINQAQIEKDDLSESGNTFEVETMKSSYNHAVKTIAKLRSTLLRYKFDKVPQEKRLSTSDVSSQKTGRRVSFPALQKDSDTFSMNEDNEDTYILNKSYNWDEILASDVQENAKKDNRKKHSKEKHVTKEHSGTSKDVPSLTDSSDSEEETESRIDHKALSSEINASQAVDDNSILKYLNEKGLVSLSKDEYLNLKRNNVEELSLDDLKQILESRDHVILPKKIHENLLTASEMNNKLREKELVTLPSQDHEKLLEISNKYGNPDLSYLKEKLSSLGYDALKKENAVKLIDLQNKLNTPGNDFLFSKAEERNLHLLPKKEYERLVELATNPKEEHLKSKARNFGFTLVPIDELSSLKNINFEKVTQDAKSLNCTVVSRADFEKLNKLAYNPDFKQISKAAEGLGFEVVSIDDMKKLKKSISDPESSYIKEMAAKLNLTVIENTEYEALVQKLNSPSLEQIKKYADDHNSVIIDRNEFVNLERNANDISIETLLMRLEPAGLKVMDSAEFKAREIEYNNPLLETLNKKLGSYNHISISREKLDELKSISESPSYEMVSKFAGIHQCNVIKSDELEELKTKAYNPDMKHVREILASRDLEFLTTNEYSEMKLMINNPPIEHLREACEKSGFVVIEKEEFERMKLMILKPEKEFLQKKALNMNMILIDESEYESLQNRYKTPSFEYLQSKTNGIGYSLIETKEYENMIKVVNEPSKDLLEKHASRLELRLVDLAEFEKLESYRDKPSLDHIKNMAERAGHVIIPADDHSLMKRKIDDPSMEELSASVKTKGHEMVELSRLTGLLELSSDPPVDFLKNKCIEKGLTAIPEESYTELMNLAHKPSKSHITDKAKGLGLIALPLAEYQLMKGKIESPSKGFLQENARKANLVLIDSSEHEKLNEMARSTSHDVVSKRAKSAGLSVISPSELEELRKWQNPSVNMLEEKSKQLDMKLVKLEEYEKLKTSSERPSLALMTQRAEEMGYTVVDSSEYQTLFEEAKNPTRDAIIVKAKKHGMVATDENEHNQLFTQANHPSIDQLMRLAEEKNYSIILKDDLAKLKNPTLAEITSMASVMGHNLIPKEELKQLRKPSFKRVNELAQQMGYITMPQSEHKKLIEACEKPSRNYVEQHAKEHGLVAIDKHEYDELTHTAKNPSKELIMQKAQSHELIAIPQKDHTQLLHFKENPSLEYLRDKIGAMGLFIVSSREHEKLRSLERIHDDSEKGQEYRDSVLAELSASAKNIGCEVITSVELDNLKNQLDKPSIEDISKKAQSMNYVVAKSSDFNEMKQQLDHPTLDFLKKHLKDFNYTALTTEEFDCMREAQKNPDLSYLIQNSKSKGLDVFKRTSSDSKESAHKRFVEMDSKKEFFILDQEEYEDIIHKIEHPDLDYLKEKIGTYSMKVLSLEECEDLTSTRDSPSEDFLSAKASAFGKVLVSKDDFHRFTDFRSKGDVENLSLIAASLGMVVLSVNSHKELKAKSERTLEDLASSRKKVLLDEDKHELLIQSVENPLVEFLKEKAKAKKMILIEEMEYNRIKERADETLESKAESHGLTLIDDKELSSLRETINQPPLSYLEEKTTNMKLKLLPHHDYDLLLKQSSRSIYEHADSENMVALSKTDHDELRSKIEQPDLETIKACALEKMHIVIPKEEYVSLNKQASSPRLDFMKKKLKDHLFVAIKEEDHSELLKRANESLKAKADRMGYVALPVADYDDLHKLANNPHLDHVNEKAKSLDMNLIPNELLKHYEQLKSETIEDRAAQLSKKVIDVDLYNHMTSKIEKPDIKFLDSKASEQGFSLIPSEELKGINDKLTNPSFDFLESKSREKGYYLIKEGIFRDLEKKANYPIHDKAKDMDCILLSAHEHRTLQESAEKSLESRALDAGCKILPISDYERLNSESSIPLEKRVKEAGLIALSEQEFSDMKRKIDNPSHEYLQQKAARLGLSLYETLELSRLLMKLKDKIESDAAELGCVVLDLATYNNLIPSDNIPLDIIRANSTKHNVKLLSLEEFERLNAKALEPIESKADSLGCKVVQNDEYVKLISHFENPTLLFLSSKVKESGFLLISAQELDELKTRLNYYNEQEKNILFNEIDEDKVVNYLCDHPNLFHKLLLHKSNEVDLNAVAKDIILNDLNTEELFRISKARGYLMVLEGTFEADVKHEDNNKSLLPQDVPPDDLDEYVDATEIFDLEDEDAGQPSSPSSRKSSYSSERAHHGSEKDAVGHLEPQSREKVSSESSLGGSIVSDEYNSGNKNMVAALESTKDIHEEASENANIKKAIEKQGYMCIPKHAFIASGDSTVFDTDNVKVIPADLYKNLMSLGSLNIENVSDEIFKEYAAKRGYEHKSDMDRDRSLQNLIEGNNIQSDMKNTKSVLTPPNTSGKPRSSYGPSKLGTIAHSPSIRSNISSHSRRSIGDSLRSDVALSIATFASLTDTSMIPAITQVVIGEYLFKYYRRMGPFTSITETRHERYFWVHPYSLTLYWSTSNPVLSNPSEVKTKAAAIISVESVSDNNPLPTGLYHKSIIVHSQNRSIKITCPTRKRHNIWYNALRYLINRNADDLTMEVDEHDTREEEENPRPITDELNDIEDRHALPRRLVSSQTLRSSSYRISRFSSLRKKDMA